jgi:hypothetical protein
MSGAQNGRLKALIETALAQPAYPAAHKAVDAIRARHGSAVRAVLFYGSCRRSMRPDGVLDFYVLVDSYRHYHASMFRSLMNYLLPPDVSFMSIEISADDNKATAIAAKVTVISLDQFSRRMRPDGIDTTLWARFTQPASLLFAADNATKNQVIAALATAVRTACGWAAGSCPAGASSSQFWNQLFGMTYDAELRVERGNRPQIIYDNDADYFDGIFNALELDKSHGPLPASHESWALRRAAGKALSVLRLCKAAFTFEGGVDYLLWKIERHTGNKVPLSPWQQRHPILAAPRLLVRLYRQGILR